jgi:hypothetical protein
MAQFYWSPVPRFDSCLGCGASNSDGGFIDTLTDVPVTRKDGGPAGYFDAIFCATCVAQMGKMVGLATKAEVEELVYQSVAKDEEIEKLKDEVQAHSERFNVLVTATASELREFADSKRAEPDATPGP